MSKRFDDLAMSLAAEGTVGRRSMMRGALAALGLGAGAVVAGAKPAAAAKRINCPPGLTACGDVCRDLDSSNDNCGTCGTACGLDSVCRDGLCVKVDCTCEPSCPTGLIWCGACVNTATDPAHCGGCGAACPSGQVCSNGACVQCVSDGECPVGNECLTYTCVAGVCQPQPSPDGTICNGGGGSCSAGSCVTTTCPSDQLPCGSTCCPTYPGATVTCGFDGTCTYTCLEGWIGCNGGFCDTDVHNDENNCGACGNACSSGQTCVNGECVTTCTPATCEDLGKTCGAHPDGCGGTLNCGTCSGGTRCVDGVCDGIQP